MRAINQTATRWLGDSTVSAAAAALPQLRGFGEVRDLRVAMSGDPVLQGLVADFAASMSNDLAALKAGAEAILYRWAGVEGVAADAIGTGGFEPESAAFETLGNGEGHRRPWSRAATRRLINATSGHPHRYCATPRDPALSRWSKRIRRTLVPTRKASFLARPRRIPKFSDGDEGHL